jgi:hypothetical protein
MRQLLIGIPLLLLPACGSAPVRSDPALYAMAPATTDVPASGAAAPARPVARFPESVLRDPAERFRLIERLRTEVVGKTLGVPEARWRGALRPALRKQLTAAGLAASDVDFLLWEIDQARNSAQLGG